MQTTRPRLSWVDVTARQADTRLLQSVTSFARRSRTERAHTHIHTQSVKLLRAAT